MRDGRAPRSGCAVSSWFIPACAGRTPDQLLYRPVTRFPFTLKLFATSYRPQQPPIVSTQNTNVDNKWEPQAEDT